MNDAVMVMTVQNTTEGIQAEILLLLSPVRFRVTLKDLDSGESLPEGRTFTEMVQAIAYAHEIAGECSCCAQAGQ